jgi:hypothetical protein
MAALTMKPLPEAHFEYGQTRTFEGILREHPVPSLVVRRPGIAAEAGAETRHLLTLPGKHGAGPLVKGRDGVLVRLEGTLAWRGNQSLIEVVEGSLQWPDGGDGSALSRASDKEDLASLSAAGEDRGVHRIKGEIVGAKCFLGVMIPGESKVHQACASLCIRGGVPPLFVTQAGGETEAYLLVDDEGHALGTELLPLVGGRVELQGRVTRIDGWNLLWLDDAALQAAMTSFEAGFELGFEVGSARSLALCPLPETVLGTKP